MTKKMKALMPIAMPAIVSVRLAGDDDPAPGVDVGGPSVTVAETPTVMDTLTLMVEPELGDAVGSSEKLSVHVLEKEVSSEVGMKVMAEGSCAGSDPPTGIEFENEGSVVSGGIVKSGLLVVVGCSAAICPGLGPVLGSGLGPGL